MDTHEEHLSIGATASALSVSTITVRRWADAGKIKHVRTPGGHRMFPASEIRRILTPPADVPQV